MLDLKVGREAAPPKLAATVLPLRDGPDGLEVFMVKRSSRSGWLGGVLVFPGGKVEAHDAEPVEVLGASPLVPQATLVAALREAFEESFLLLTEPAARDPHALHAAMLAGAPFMTLLAEHRLALDARSLVPFARWLTPEAEARRFDTFFFLAHVPAEHQLSHDSHETSASLWVRPSDALQRFERGEFALVPPTHRSLEQLAEAQTVAEALHAARVAERVGQTICPELVTLSEAAGDVLSLTLPGDPLHSNPSPMVPGKSRYVLRNERWLPEDP